ncbi:MAG: hypothetical protein K9J13_00095 [Saprospiraceae bacterium]|nr:hypothetical protein [Saprospiraceae bacterium]
MQRLIKTNIVVLAIAIAFSTSLSAQKKQKAFSGIITFEIQYPKSGNETADLLSEAPTEYTVKILGNKSKSETVYGGIYFTEIVNGDNKTKIVLIESGAKKGSYFKDTKEEIEEELDYKDDPVVEFLDDTMTICGYICKKAKVTSINAYDEEIKNVVYYTDEIGSKEINFNSDFREIDGFILREESIDRKGKVTIEFAKEIKNKKIKDIEFLVPATCEEITGEEKVQYKKWIYGDE